MCGIAGSLHFRLNTDQLKKDLWHRGPDDQTVFNENGVTLYHHRLAILDIATGKQPMHHAHLSIIFNGEIYNHQEVRETYKLSGITSSDTETILKAYEKLGADCLHAFDGMFAFVIYDRNKNELFIARDRAGKKPFYYYKADKQFVFASELNALNNQVHASVNTLAIDQFLRYGAFHHTQTPYAGIVELPPGHYAQVNIATTEVKIHSWWNIDSYYKEKNSDSFDVALQKTDQFLHTAVKRRLESSDLEVGSFLSGGIDSGLVTAIAAGYNHSLQTFTVSFDGTYDEAPLARLVAAKYNTSHTEINITFNDLQQDIEKILANYGEPFYDDSAIPSYYVSREAKKYLTVILNGDGSDELFGGYRRYVPFSKYDFFQKSGLMTGMAGLMRKLIPVSHNKQSKLNYLYRLADLASQKGTDVYLSGTTDIFNGYFQYFSNQDSNSLVPLQERLSAVNQQKLTGLQKIMLMDFTSILPDILLVKMDIATMASSLEGRSPFLCKEIMEYAPGMDDAFKIKGVTTKHLLRQLAKKYLPAELIDQPKRGFEVPLKKWVNQELKEIIFSYLDSSSSYADEYIDKKFIRNLLQNKIQVSEEKRAKMLYTLFALNVWHTKCVKN
jgi:asparagine synthase (glutamine-hydrolysing)